MSADEINAIIDSVKKQIKIYNKTPPGLIARGGFHNLSHSPTQSDCLLIIALLKPRSLNGKIYTVFYIMEML